jgi:cob(I)alamin adenosyltransferase
MLSGKYGLVVFDEVNAALALGLLCEGEILAVLDEKPAAVEVVLTGRGATPALLRRADLVTEMRCRKHYYDRGVGARRGIED